MSMDCKHSVFTSISILVGSLLDASTSIEVFASMILDACQKINFDKNVAKKIPFSQEYEVFLYELSI